MYGTLTIIQTQTPDGGGGGVVTIHNTDWSLSLGKTVLAECFTDTKLDTYYPNSASSLKIGLMNN